MAGGAPSRQSQALAQAKTPITLDLDKITAQTPPRVTHTFGTALIRTHAEPEVRDDEGNITTPASFDLEFIGAAIIMPVGDTILVQGGEAYRTNLSPDYAVMVLEGALAEAREVAASRKEQPVNSSIPIASSMAEVAAAADQAAAVEQDLKGDGH